MPARTASGLISGQLREDAVGGREAQVDVGLAVRDRKEAGFEGLCGESSWPEYDEAKTVEDVVEMAVQVNGKVRSTITLPKDADEGEASAIALADEKIQRCTEGKKIVKTIYRPGRIFNIVVK